MIERLPDPLERLPDPDPPPERAGSLQWVGMLSVAMVAIVADQVTKRLVSDRVGMDEVHQVLPFLDVRHVRNTGIAFGVFPDRLELVSVATAIAVGWMLLHFARSGARHVLFPVALGLIIGAASRTWSTGSARDTSPTSSISATGRLSTWRTASSSPGSCCC